MNRKSRRIAKQVSDASGTPDRVMKNVSKSPGKSSRTSRKVARKKSPNHTKPAASGTADNRNLDRSPAKSNGDLFPIVGVGASAGGLEAFTRLVEQLPADTGMAFVLVQHLDPEHESKLPQLLGRATALPVLEVVNNTRVKANHIYVIPPNRTMTIERRTLKLLPRQKTDKQYRSIDRFLESLATDQGPQAIGVILSGTASDGTLGLQAIKGEGGITFAQDESAKYDSMPRSAVAAGDVDFVLPPERIARELARIAEHPYVVTPDDTTEDLPETASDDAERNAFKKIMLLLRNHRGADFTLYRPNTIRRRILRRMVLAKIRTLAAYGTHLRNKPEELEALYQDLLIAVTSFFRNPEAFDLLKRKVFPALLKDRSPDDVVRVWTVGCSTGQEAYSIAMAFLEYLGEISRNVSLQIFATDLNDDLLEKARAGFYSKSLVQDISPERLGRFFIEEDGGYRISKTIREMCVFARQNVITDPPFSRTDLISCRNLLIYLDQEVQRRMLNTFHYALKPEGFLFLGMSESVGTLRPLFAPVDKKVKVFAKKPGRLHELPHVPLAHHQTAPLRLVHEKARQWEARGLSAELNAQQEADRIALSRYSPPAVIINDALEILHFRGNTEPYLSPPTGRATFNILKMAREGLMISLRQAINQAKKENRTVRKEDLRLKQDGEAGAINIEVIPLRNIKEPCLLVVFEPAGSPAKSSKLPRKGTKVEKRNRKSELREAARLEKELADTRDYLQAVQEQYDATNEELQASAEETQSANEELQSINEELETSKEELESTNEELTTVNEEMVNRNTELIRLHSDIVNLQNSINTPVVLLGRDLSVRSFTQPAETLFNLLATDIGRRLAVVRHNLDCPDLDKFAAQVIAEGATQEHEVQDNDGRWFLLRITPYMTREKQIDGAVLLLIDISESKRAEEATARLAAIVESSEDAIIGKDLDGTISAWNRGAEKLFGYRAPEAIGQPITVLMSPDDVGEESRIMDKIRRGESVAYYETIGLRKDGTSVDIWLTVSPVFDDRGAIVGASRIARDITARKRAEKELADLLISEQHARTNAEAANKLKDEFLAIVSHEIRTPLNAIVGWVQILRSGKLNQEQVNKALETIDRNAASQTEIIAELLDTSRIVSGNLNLNTKSISIRPVIEAAIDILRPTAAAKAIEIKTKFDKRIQPVWGDSARLHQVFSNILSNAMKFTSTGGRVEVSCEDKDENVVIMVKDDGIGIEPGFLPFVFDRFRQADATSARSFGGLGLGLSIVRNIVELHGGSIRAESEGKDRGATITMILPGARALQQAKGIPGAREKQLTSTASNGAKLDGVRVIVVDDDLDTRDLLKVALGNAGAAVKTCSSTADALSALKTWRADCLVSDIGMPGEDGYELLKKVRALKKSEGGRIPAIALTGFAAATDRVRSNNAGYQVHLAKPVVLSELTSQIARLVGEENHSQD
jgi:two-component system, chemotaxis family, CheB/CheR fusion protein